MRHPFSFQGVYKSDFETNDLETNDLVVVKPAD